MAEEKRSDDVEKFLSEQKVLEDRKQALIDDLLKLRAAVMVAFDEKLEQAWVSGEFGQAETEPSQEGLYPRNGSRQAWSEAQGLVNPSCADRAVFF